MLDASVSGRRLTWESICSISTFEKLVLRRGGAILGSEESL